MIVASGGTSPTVINNLQPKERIMTPCNNVINDPSNVERASEWVSQWNINEPKITRPYFNMASVSSGPFIATCRESFMLPCRSSWYIAIYVMVNKHTYKYMLGEYAFIYVYTCFSIRLVHSMLCQVCTFYTGRYSNGQPSNIMATLFASSSGSEHYVKMLNSEAASTLHYP